MIVWDRMLRTWYARAASAAIGLVAVLVSVGTTVPASAATIAPDEINISIGGGSAELVAGLTWINATSYKLTDVYLCDLKSDGKAPEFQASDTWGDWPKPPYEDSNGDGSCRYWDTIKRSSGHYDEGMIGVHFHVWACGSGGCTGGEWSVWHYNPYDP
ncbi:MAG TPA: hypothetical protein VGL93_23220 [Streptosporangiaceae bacterium]|jgi:hypothetical protein